MESCIHHCGCHNHRSTPLLVYGDGIHRQHSSHDLASPVSSTASCPNCGAPEASMMGAEGMPLGHEDWTQGHQDQAYGNDGSPPLHYTPGYDPSSPFPQTQQGHHHPADFLPHLDTNSDLYNGHFNVSSPSPFPPSHHPPQRHRPLPSGPFISVRFIQPVPAGQPPFALLDRTLCDTYHYFINHRGRLLLGGVQGPRNEWLRRHDGDSYRQLSRHQEERVYARHMSTLQAAVYVRGGGWVAVYPPTAAGVGGYDGYVGADGAAGRGRRGDHLPGVDSRGRSGNEPRSRRHSGSSTSSTGGSSSESRDDGYDGGDETGREAPAERPFGLQTIRTYLSRDGRTVEELAEVMNAAAGEVCGCCGFSYDSEDGRRLQQVIDSMPVASAEGSGGLWE